MAPFNLPIHPSQMHPLTGLPLRAVYVDSKGRARFPIMGAEDAPPAEAPAKPDAPGFPANTPVEQMSTDQREAYHRTQAQKWQGRAENNYALLRELGITSPEEAAAIKEKVSRHDALQHELMSEKDKAVAEAQRTAKAEADSQYRPLLVRAQFQAVAAGKIEPARLEAILEPLDMSKFLTRSGEVDTEKVSAYVAGLEPAKGTRPAGPSTFGLGTHTAPPSAPGEQGRAMAARRFGTQS